MPPEGNEAISGQRWSEPCGPHGFYYAEDQAELSVLGRGQLPGREER